MATTRPDSGIFTLRQPPPPFRVANYSSAQRSPLNHILTRLRGRQTSYQQIATSGNNPPSSSSFAHALSPFAVQLKGRSRRVESPGYHSISSLPSRHRPSSPLPLIFHSSGLYRRDTLEILVLTLIQFFRSTHLQPSQFSPPSPVRPGSLALSPHIVER